MNANDAAPPAFRWDDPFLLDEQLEDDERMVRDNKRLNLSIAVEQRAAS